MNVSEGVRQRTRARLPGDVTRPFEVYVNGVPQVEGRDYRVEGGELLFEQVLRREGQLGFWRWARILVGVAGTYRQNDVVDVAYESGGRRAVASGLPVQPAA